MAAKKPLDMSNPRHFKVAVQNVRNVHDSADAATQEAGRTWYPQVHDAVAKGVKGTSTSERAGAGLVSAVSPNMDWEGGNIHALRELHRLKAADFANINKGDRTSLKGLSISAAYGSGIEKAHRIMQGEDPDHVLTGPKTNAFFHNIHEPHVGGPVTVDGRAYDIAHNRLQTWTADRGISGQMHTPKGVVTSAHVRYNRVADVYRSAASAISQESGQEIHPHDVQAVTWEQGKRIERSGTTASGQPRKVGVRRMGQPYL